MTIELFYDPVDGLFGDVRLYLPRPATREEKDAAHREFQKAYRKNQIVLPTHCELCKREPTAPRFMRAHHRDYAQPLSVQWLCAGCHAYVHDVAKRIVAP